MDLVVVGYCGTVKFGVFGGSYAFEVDIRPAPFERRFIEILEGEEVKEEKILHDRFCRKFRNVLVVVVVVVVASAVRIEQKRAPEKK